MNYDMANFQPDKRDQQWSQVKRATMKRLHAATKYGPLSDEVKKAWEKEKQIMDYHVLTMTPKGSDPWWIQVNQATMTRLHAAIKYAQLSSAAKNFWQREERVWDRAMKK
ncbi:MAG: hypothetical protein WCI73_06440 [Phycisphaerae bacterium]